MRDIRLPLARPALAVGIALALLETLNDIGASEYLGVQTLTLSIFTTWLNRGSLPGAAQIALAMLALVAALDRASNAMDGGGKITAWRRSQAGAPPRAIVLTDGRPLAGHWRPASCRWRSAS